MWKTFSPVAGCLLVSCGSDASRDSAPAEQPDAHSNFAFHDVAPAAGIDAVMVSGDPRRWYIIESNGSGAAWIDHDSDGDLDLFLGNGQEVRYVDDGARLELGTEASTRLYRNDRTGDGDWTFTDVTDAAGARRGDWVNGTATGDLDNDGDTDLYLACFGRNALLENRAAVFAEVGEERGVADGRWSAAAAFGDADRDGDLDLFVANYVEFDLDAPPDGGRRPMVEGVEIGWGPVGEHGQGHNPGAPNGFFLNDGSGSFADATAAAGFALPEALCSYAAVFSDVDRDGWQDVLVANDLQPCSLFMGTGEGRFEEQGRLRGFATDSKDGVTSAMGLALADVDADGDLDVLRTNFDLEPNSLHLNDGAGNFRERGASLGLAQASMDRLGWAAGFFDADLDGDPDLAVANGHVLPQAEEIGMSGWAMGSQLFEARRADDGGLQFHDVTAEVAGELGRAASARGLALGDPDNDGDIDLLITAIDAPPRLLENRSERRGRWIGVRTVGSRSNRDGYGAVVTVRAGDARWVREVRTAEGLYCAHDPRLHFGLGEVERIDWIEVVWPSGAVQRVEDPPLERYLTLEEPPTTPDSPATDDPAR